MKTLFESIQLKQGDAVWLVVGLGNPGRQYEKTWHNAGFMTLEIVSQRHKITIDRIKFKGVYGRGYIGSTPVILLKPATYMNLSGDSVQEAATYFKIPHERILTIYDDLDVETGCIRIREKGGAGTHNGMRSVVNRLATDLFPRIRVGIGPLPEAWDLVGYVLSEVPKDRQTLLWQGLNLAADAVEICLDRGIARAMNQCNIRKKVQEATEE